MELLVGFYQDKSRARTAEFVECVRRNTDNPHIDRVTVFLEDDVRSADVLGLHPDFSHSKITVIPHGARLTFVYLFEYANAHLAGKSVAIANADIFFDETLALLNDAIPQRSMLCLSRWDERSDGSRKHYDRPYSQDAWIFVAPVPPIAADFFLGIPGCDNRLAYEAERAGLTVTNPSRSVRARHLHLSGVHHYTLQDTLDGPRRFVPASFFDGRAFQASTAVVRGSKPFANRGFATPDALPPPGGSTRTPHLDRFSLASRNGADPPHPPSRGSAPRALPTVATTAQDSSAPTQHSPSHRNQRLVALQRGVVARTAPRVTSP